MSDSVSIRSAQEEMDRVVKTPFLMLRAGDPIKQMLIDLMTKPEPAEITELKRTHPQLQAVMKRCEATRKIYTRIPNNQGQLDDWAKTQDDKSDSLNHQILKELIAAFIIQTPRPPVPPILEPLLADIDWAELQAEWRKKDSAIKSAAQSMDLKQVMEKRSDAVGYALDRIKICDRELAKVKSLRDAVGQCGQGPDSAAKAQFLASNLILADFVIELVDLIYPEKGERDDEAITAAVRAMCADIIAATNADSPVFALGSKTHSCQTRFNSLRAVRMRSHLSYSDQALEYPAVKEGQVVETLMTLKLKSHRLPHSINTLRARADTPKRDKEEPSKRSASQEAKAAKEAAKEAKK